MNIDTYRPGDEAAILSCWRRSLPADAPAMGVFVRRVLCDPNFDPEGLFVLRQGERITGFLLAIARRVPLFGADLEPEVGWITAFGVEPDVRRHGYGRRLFAAAEAYLRQGGSQRIEVSPYAPNYIWPGVDPAAYPEATALLTHLGYDELYTCAAMHRSLAGYAVPETIANLEAERRAEGYRFGTLAPQHVVGAIRLAHHAFHADWSRAIRESIAGGLPLDQVFVAVDPAGDVVGFSVYGAYDGVDERFGPFGVDPGQRGKGIGAILLHRTMEAMRARGLLTAWFLWTGETTAAGRLYLRAGFEVTRRFSIFRKQFE